MRETIVAEVTRIGEKFNIRLLYGEDRETIRFCSDENQEFACNFLKKAYLFDNVGGFVLYDVEKDTNVTKVTPDNLDHVAVEGGQNLSVYDAIAFLNTVGYGLQNLDIRGTLKIYVPDLGIEMDFEEPWQRLLSEYFT